MLINIDRFLEALPIAGVGMAGVFVVIAAIFLCIKGLSLLFKDKNENQ